MLRRALIVATILAMAGMPGCASTQKTCGPIVHDALDPGSGTHVLPGAPAPHYLVDPPTSGAHQPGPTIEGPVRKPIVRALQVGVLEEGRVLIQYHGLSDADISKLEALNSPQVVVAPADKLPKGTAVVATAWVTHQTCSAVDVPALREFVTARVGKGPAQGGNAH